MEQFTHSDLIRKYTPAIKATDKGFATDPFLRYLVVKNYMQATLESEVKKVGFIGGIQNEQLLRKVDKVGWEKLPRDLVNAAIKSVKEYFKKYGLDIDSYSLSSYLYFRRPTQKFADPEELDSFGQTGIDGKIQNNFISIVSTGVNISTPQRNYDKVYVNLGTLIHEILHKLLNIDNTINLDGQNLARIMIPKVIREGSIQYITELLYHDLDEVMTEKLGQIPPQFYFTFCNKNNIYNEQVNAVHSYLLLLAESLSQKENIDLNITQKAIYRLFLSFFIQSDKCFLELPEKYKLLDKDGQPIKDFISNFIEQLEIN